MELNLTYEEWKKQDPLIGRIQNVDNGLKKIRLLEAELFNLIEMESKEKDDKEKNIMNIRINNMICNYSLMHI
jgi:hypothetical protein